MREHDMEELMNDIRKRLDVLIALNIKNELKNDTHLTMREVISFLDSLGLKYTEIAKIFGKTPSYVAGEISKIKKGGKKNDRTK